MDTITEEDFKTVLNNKNMLLNHYNDQEEILLKIFKDYPGFDYQQIITRITLLNQFYSTSILDINLMAEHICELAKTEILEKKLEIGDTSAIYQISKLDHRKRGDSHPNFWYHTSFATKFASFTNPKAYPIYDSLVIEVFSKLKKQLLLGKFSLEYIRKNENGYSLYKDVYQTFMQESGINEIKINGENPNFKQVDNYLWYSRKIANMIESGYKDEEHADLYESINNNWINSLMRQHK